MRLKPLYAILILTLTCVSLLAQKAVKMNVSATEMFKNDAFELEITLENFDSDASVKYPDFDDLLKISGPFQSSRTSIVNGAVTRSISLSYRFSPKRTGSINIGPAVITEGGKKYESNSVKITVHEQGNITGGDSREMFILAAVSSNDVYVGEIVKIDYTLYIKPELKISLPSVTGEPKFTNFVRERVNISADRLRSLVQTVHKGVKYNTLPLATYRITPTSAGERVIESLTVNVPVEVRTRRRSGSFFNDPFFDDDLFSTFRSHSDKAALSEEIKINVKPLPTAGRPESFRGAVGSFRIESSTDADSVAVNEGVNLRVTVSGTGNINDINELAPDFPPGLEVYNPKRTVIQDPEKGNSGRVVFEYLVLPRDPGKHLISNIKFSFFDPSSGSYRTVSAKDRVIKASGSDLTASRQPGSARRTVEILASDIRYIKKDPGNIFRAEGKFFDPVNFSILLSFNLLVIILSLTLRIRLTKNSHNTAAGRKKKAVRNAAKRLKKCYTSLNNGDMTPFYKYLDEALLKFIADKFNISHAGIITDEIASKLKVSSVDQTIIDDLISLLNKSASIQFAPVKPGEGEMTDDIEKAKNIMSVLNERLK